MCANNQLSQCGCNGHCNGSNPPQCFSPLVLGGKKLVASRFCGLCTLQMPNNSKKAEKDCDLRRLGRFYHGYSLL